LCFFFSETDTQGVDYDDESAITFSISYLTEQITAGSGKLCSRFEDFPSNKYDSCYLITDRPNQTAKFILCLAYGIQIVSHTWIIDCCKVSGFNTKDTVDSQLSGFVGKFIFLDKTPDSLQK
jgi:hypothetical protein